MAKSQGDGPSLSKTSTIGPTNPRKPKSRPPQSFRDKLLHTLPKYSGPYSVGCMEIEVPAQNPRQFSNISRHKKPLLKLETILVTVYYPSAFGSGEGPAPGGHEKWSRATWIPRPRRELARAYARFAGLPSWAVAGWLGTTTLFTKLPAYRNSKLAEHWPAEQNSRDGGYEVKNQAGKRPEGELEKPTFPLLMFSHGLGGTRTSYSSVCGEFASYGFVVCAIEHRDGSGPRTFVNLGINEQKAQNERLNGKEQARSYSVMDYVFPKGNARDTAPGNDKGVDKELRDAQIELRLAEIDEAYRLMCLINEGKGEDIAHKNLRRKGNIGSSSRGLDGIDWNAWKGRLHEEQVTMLGHSFGAATTVEVLRHDARFSWIGQGILYDPWGAVIEPSEKHGHCKIDKPLLAINSEAFMYWADNFNAVRSLCTEAKDQGALSWMMTVRGTVHISQSDFSVLYPHLSSLLLKMTVNPQRAIDLNINASLEFLRKVMPERISSMNRGTHEHLLCVSVIDDLPTDHHPGQKYLAMRLHVPHEVKLRLTHKLITHRARKQTKVPRTPTGKPLVGLESFEIGKETWMHIAPTKKELAAHGLQLCREVGCHQGDGVAHKAGEGPGEGQNGQQERRVGDNEHAKKNIGDAPEGIEQRMMDRG
jgi:platelet-activating factor acetylhydrolase